MDHEDESAVFKALSEPVRLQILDMLSCGEVCACELLERLTISQSTLSHHMKVLIDSGLVVARRRAVWVHYSIREESVAELHRSIDALTLPKADCAGKTKRGC